MENRCIQSSKIFFQSINSEVELSSEKEVLVEKIYQILSYNLTSLSPENISAKFADHIKIFCQIIVAVNFFNQMCQLAHSYSTSRQVSGKYIYDIHAVKLKIVHADVIFTIAESNIDQITLLINKIPYDEEHIFQKIKSMVFFLKHNTREHLDNLLFIHGASGYMSNSRIAKLWGYVQELIDAMPLDFELMSKLPS